MESEIFNHDKERQIFEYTIHGYVFDKIIIFSLF